LIDPTLKRIAGMHVCDNGDHAFVWLSHDSIVGEVTVYDSCIFKKEVAAVIAEGINARGRFIPIAWANKVHADSLLERGCRMIPEGVDQSNSMAEVLSREIWESMRRKSFKFDKRLKDWREEAETFQKDKDKIPTDTHPLMAATRNAVAKIKFAKRQQSRLAKRKEGRRVAVI